MGFKKKTCIVLLLALSLAACKTKHKVTDIATVKEKVEIIEVSTSDLKQFKGEIEAANINLPVKIERLDKTTVIHNAKKVNFDFVAQKTDTKKEVKQETKLKLKKKELKKSKPSYIIIIIVLLALIWLFFYLKYGRNKTQN